jgi:nitroimidazol reductase NimA-like FMN-containing flavoprotein (pyridoxamine 5'-phosphate oxidase superfamily)
MIPNTDTERPPKPKDLILRLLDEHRVMAVGTKRPDGWPQVTMVGYVNDGFLLYCFVARNSQKFVNIQRDPRVSIAIGSDAPRPSDIRGLSLAGRACAVTDKSEFEYVRRLRLRRYPEYAALPESTLREPAAQRVTPRPALAELVLLRIAPEIISVLDYARGFGTTHLVTFSERDLDVHIESRRYRWDVNES